jgi:hypothetical protein
VPNLRAPPSKEDGLPLRKVFHRRGTQRGSWQHGRGPAVCHQRHPPSFAWGGSSFSEQGTRFTINLIVDQPRTRWSQVLDVFFPAPCWFVYCRCACFLCVVRGKLHRTSLPVTLDHHTTGERPSRSQVDDVVLVVRWSSNFTFLRVTPDR